MKNLNEPDQPQALTPVVIEPGSAGAPVAEVPVLDPQPEPELLDSVPARFCCFVTGTDTEIGKTLVSSAILHKLVEGGRRACGMKPVAAGAELIDGELHNEDADMLRAAGNVNLPQNITTPFLLKEPAAPHIAAAMEGVTIEPVPILAAYTEIQAASDAVVVEGVGGFRVPFNDDFDSADLAAQLNLPVILVVGLRLGCISHALLTVEAIVARGLVLAGWVANSTQENMRFERDNIDALEQRIPAPLLGHVPRLENPTAAAAAHYIDLAGLPGWHAPRAQN